MGAIRAPVPVGQFLKWYINCWEGPGGYVLRALNALRTGEQFIWYQGALVELLTAATNVEPRYQGYLITSRKEPMQASDVGSMLGVDGRRALRVLTRLETVGFLERAPWPPPIGGGDDKEECRTLQSRQKGAGASRSPGRRAPKNRPGTTKNRGSPNNVELETGNLLAQEKKVEFEQRKGQPGCAGTLEALEAPPAPPTAAPAISTTPTRSDGGARPALASRVGPPSIIAIGAVLHQQRHRYSEAANDFADRVLTASGYRAPNRAEYANERAHFAKAYCDLEARVRSEARRDKAREKTLRVATEVGAARAAYRKPEAYILRTLQNARRDAARTQAGRGSA